MNETLRIAYRWLDRCGEKAAGAYLRQHREELRRKVNAASRDCVEDFSEESNQADAALAELRELEAS